MHWRISLKATLALLLCLSPSLVDGAPRKTRKQHAPEDPAQANAKVVDLFQAVKDKQIMASFQALATAEGMLTLTNLTSEPLNVELPLTFAAVPAIPKAAGAAGPGPQGNAGLDSLTPKSLGCVIDPRQRAIVGTDRKRADKSAEKEKKDAPAKNGGKKAGDKPAKDEEADESDADDAANEQKPKGGDNKSAKKAPAKTDKSKTKPKDDKETKVTVIPLPAAASLPLTVTCVGLEFDRAEATPLAAYSVAPVEDATKQPTLEVLLMEMAEGKVKDPLTAQAVAYHFSGKSWDDLTLLFAAQLPQAKTLAAQLEKKAKVKAKAGDDKADAQAGGAQRKPKSAPVRNRRKKPVEDESGFDQ